MEQEKIIIDTLKGIATQRQSQYTEEKIIDLLNSIGASTSYKGVGGPDSDGDYSIYQCSNLFFGLHSHETNDLVFKVKLFKKNVKEATIEYVDLFTGKSQMINESSYENRHDREIFRHMKNYF